MMECTIHKALVENAESVSHLFEKEKTRLFEANILLSLSDRSKEYIPLFHPPLTDYSKAVERAITDAVEVS